MNKPHPHADVIKAWADGAQTQYYALGKWHDMVDEPIWYRDQQYRIKPEPKPDVVVEWLIGPKEVTYFDHAVKCAKKNIRLTFDGETHELKSAEVL